MVAYYSDVSIVNTVKFLYTLKDVVQVALRELEILAITCGVWINPNKTEFVFYRGNNDPYF